MTVFLYNKKIQYIDVRLKYEWMGYPPGSELTLARHVVEELASRGSVTIIDEDEDIQREFSDIVETDMDHDEQDVDEQNEEVNVQTKIVTHPVKDKMIKRTKSKRAKRKKSTS